MTPEPNRVPAPPSPSKPGRSGHEAPEGPWLELAMRAADMGAIAWDLERRGIGAADAVAIGDSARDLDLAPAVGRLWITAGLL